ncbi:MAG: response regulator [Deltaproteobacteria bacterium]|nr:response regulator [Deltaproteobacteria bacterium]
MQGTRTVLVVDDDEVLLRTLVRLLRGRWRVLAAAGGLEALRVVEQETVDLVLSDFHMPVMTGAQLAGTLRGRGFTGAVALFTAVPGDHRVQQALHLGEVCHVFPKACDTSELVGGVERLLGMTQRPGAPLLGL